MAGENRRTLLHVALIGSEIAIDYATSRLHFVDQTDDSLQSVDLNGNDRQFHVWLTDNSMIGLSVVPGRDIYYYAFPDTVYMQSYSGHKDKVSVHEGDYIEQVTIAEAVKQNGTFIFYRLLTNTNMLMRNEIIFSR